MNENYGSLDTISVAISYSRSTKEEYNEAIIDLIMDFQHRRKYKVSVYFDRHNNAGDNFTKVIVDNFEKADIIICLVSNLFLENEFIRVFERPIIQDCAFATDKRAIPIIVTKTKDYVQSWMGNIRRSTLPTAEAIQKPYSYYSNKKHADNLIRNSLDKTFKAFNKQVVSPRVRRAVEESEKKPIPRKSDLKKITIYASYVLLFILFLILISIYGESFQEKNELLPELDEKEKENFDQDDKKNFDPNEDLENDKNYPLPENQDDKEDSKEYVYIPSPRFYNQNSPTIKMCLSKSSMETQFPRDLSMYPYFGRQPYGDYESCQGLNETGYKPCKKNRIWFIVNEEKDHHLKLKVDKETQNKIYAIRPLLNNVGEVYFYDESGMYLSFCISLDDGEQIE